MSKRRSSTLEAPRPGKRSAGSASRAASLTTKPAASPGAGRIERAADAVVEACVLAALLALPLYFSALTTTSFEPDKTMLLRVYAAVAGGAWLVGALGRRGARAGARRPDPLLVLGVAFFLAYLLATLLSVDPRLSLWGIRTRQEGLVTRAAFLIVFAVSATRLRQPGRWERAVTVLVFASVPVVLYGLVQQVGLDPIPQSGDPSTVQWPVRGPFGQHIFLGSYLAMVIPFTAASALRSWDWRSAPAIRPEGDEALLFGSVAGFVALSYVGFLALARQSPALFAILPAVLAGYVLLAMPMHGLPDSRLVRQVRSIGYSSLLVSQILVLVLSGARAAVLGSLAAAAVFALLLLRRLHRVTLARGILGLILASGLFLLVLNIPNGPLQALRTVHGFDRLANITDSGGTTGSGQGRLLVWQGVGRLMTHTPPIGGRWGGPARDIVGYGPETLQWVFQSVFPLKLRQVTSEVWLWDRAHDIYLDTLVDAGLLGLLSLFAAFALFFRKAIRALRGAPDPTAWLLIAAIAAVVGYLVDGVFAVETAVTLLLVWTLFGLCVAVSRPQGETASAAPRPIAMRPALWYWPGLLLIAALVGVIPGIAGHPALVAGLWLLAAVAGVGAIAAPLYAERGDAAAEPARPGRGRLNGSTGRSRPGGRRELAVPALVLLATALVLGGQMRAQEAAVAEEVGITEISTGHTSAGLGHVQESVRANAYEPDYERDLGRLYTQLASNASGSGGTIPAPGTAPDARTFDPQGAVTLNRGQLFRFAADSMDRARALSPLSPDVYDDIGTLYLTWNKPLQALAAFHQAAQLSVDNPRYLDEEALAQLQAGRGAAAQARAESALALDRTFWYSYYTLARVDYQLHDAAAARQNAAAALVYAPLAWPAPPAGQLDEMRTIRGHG